VHDRELQDLTTRLHDGGWATHVTAMRLVQGWERLAREVADYPLTIDDFTNDLTGRDGLELLLDWASPELAAELRRRVEPADALYREDTSDDGGAALSRYFRVDESSGWWGRRRPAAGRLGDYISGHRR
jgi:hypothetical protein